MSIAFPKRKEDQNFRKNLIKDFKLVPHLDKYLGEEISDFVFEYEPKRSDTAWHPSGDCTPPPTALYSKAMDLEPREKFPVALMKTFMVGHFWHQLLQKAVLDLGFCEESAIERKGIRVWDTYEATDLPSEIVIDSVTGESITKPQTFPRAYHWATGAGDVAPCSVPEYGDCIIDFKTMSSHQFKGQGVPAWAANKYEAQINIYMDFFEQERGMILAINKDTPHDMKEFRYERNQPLIDAIYEKWEFVAACVAAGVPPDENDDMLFDVEHLCKGPTA